jgi:hypothetical protein
VSASTSLLHSGDSRTYSTGLRAHDTQRGNARTVSEDGLRELMDHPSSEDGELLTSEETSVLAHCGAVSESIAS